MLFRISTFCILFVLVHGRPQGDEIPVSCSDYEGFSCVSYNECRISECKKVENTEYNDEDLEVRQSGGLDLNCNAEKYVEELRNYECLGLRSVVSEEGEKFCCHDTDIIKSSSVCTDQKDYLCLPVSECKISKCKTEEKSEDNLGIRSGVPSIEENICEEESKHVPFLNNSCRKVDPRSEEELVCCHSSLKVEEKDPVTVNEEGNPEEIPVGCKDFEGYRCVNSEVCRLSKCILQTDSNDVSEVDVRQGVDDCDETEHIKMLNQTCDIGIRSSFSAEETCCHESFIEKEDTPTIPSTDSRNEIPEIACEDLKDVGYSCVNSELCKLYKCLPESGLSKETGDCSATEHIKNLNQNCFGLRSPLLPESSKVCCHKSFIEADIPSTTQTSPPKPTSDPTSTGSSSPRDKDFTPKCGRHNLGSLGPRKAVTLNGESSAFGEWPFVCAIFLTEGNIFLSGASLITPGVALTVAHWVDDHKKSPEQLKVRCGDWNFASSTNLVDEPQPFVEIRVKNISTHPGFDVVTARNDFGLLHLEDDFVLSETIDTICLPKSPNTGKEFLDDCYAAGWGKDSNGDSSKPNQILHHVKLPLKTKEECQDALRTQYGNSFTLHDSFICAGGKRGEDTCRGDGGGPLFCRLPGLEEEQYVEAGIIAWGHQCGLPNIPGVYASTAHGRCFIQLSTKCFHGDKYKNFIDISGCDNWLETEKAVYEKQKENMEKVLAMQNVDVDRKSNAKKELTKMNDALEKLDNFKDVCTNNQNGDVEDKFSPRKDEVDIRTFDLN